MALKSADLWTNGRKSVGVELTSVEIRTTVKLPSLFQIQTQGKVAALLNFCLYDNVCEPSTTRAFSWLVVSEWSAVVAGKQDYRTRARARGTPQ